MNPSSPEQIKPDLFDLMPDPYKNTNKFNVWFEGMLSQIDGFPQGYEDKIRPDGSKYDKDELVGFFRQQLRSDVDYWAKEKPHPRDPNRKIPASSAVDIKETLQIATMGLLKQSVSSTT